MIRHAVSSYSRTSFWSLLLASLLILASSAAVVAQNRATPEERRAATEAAIQREVHHELVMLPRYTVFDYIEYTIDDSRVTLSGYVRTDTLKFNAANAVRRVEGVTGVTNNIEILPAAPADERIRVAVFRALFTDPALQRYAQGVILPIHIIVKNGHVTLEGTVARQADKDLANVRANGVPGVFSVTNNLKVEGTTESRY